MTRVEQGAQALLAAMARGECSPTVIELYALAELVAETGNRKLTFALLRAARALEPQS
jgi:hypothetical protein